MDTSNIIDKNKKERVNKRSEGSKLNIVEINLRSKSTKAKKTKEKKSER